MKNGLAHLSAEVRFARDKSGEQSDKPIYHAVERARRRTVQDHRSGDRENFRSNAEDKALVFRIDRAGCHRIGKAGDRNERARARKGRDTVENSDPREQYGDENQRDRGEGSAVLVGQKAGIYVFQYLRQNADCPSGYESEQAVFQHR